MDWHIGTMGFGYKDWANGVFYPPGAKPSEYLSHYARHFNALELDTTFYAVPEPDRVRRWADQVPDGFRFSPKTPRGITHHSTLAGAARPMAAFVDVVRLFGVKLGPILIQFPPSFAAADFSRLETFVAHLPPAVRYAIEFRNPTWRTRQTFDLLREHRIAWCAQDYAGHRAELPVTTDFFYVRWIGQHERYSSEPLDHERVDPTAALTWWKKRIDAAGATVTDTFGYFNNEYAGYAVASAKRMQHLVNLPVAADVPTPPPSSDQPTLFG